jgi:hypothetical protein
MKLNIAIITLLYTFSLAAFASETLYTCTKNGEILLQDSKPKNCDNDTLKKFRYESYASDTEEPAGLRALEKRELKAIKQPKSSTIELSSSYQNALQDNRMDKCYFYKKQIEDAMNGLQFFTGDISQNNLKLKILQAESNMRHYCNKNPKMIYPRPDLQYAPYYGYHLSPGPAGP